MLDGEKKEENRENLPDWLEVWGNLQLDLLFRPSREPLQTTGKFRKSGRQLCLACASESQQMTHVEIERDSEQ